MFKNFPKQIILQRIHQIKSLKYQEILSCSAVCVKGVCFKHFKSRKCRIEECLLESQSKGLTYNERNIVYEILKHQRNL